MQLQITPTPTMFSDLIKIHRRLAKQEATNNSNSILET